MTWPFAELQPLSYDVIVADPPTPFETYSDAGKDKSPDAHYDTMSWEDLQKLPVSHLAKRDAYLLLWACWPTLQHSLDLMKAWGFTYKTGGAWHKRTSTGKTAFGTGYILRSASEPFLIGTVGNPKSSRRARSLIDAETRGHSRKPDAQYELCELLACDAFKFVELFARQKWPREHWDCWGNETDKFDAGAAA